jgi:hypothetical protein
MKLRALIGAFAVAALLPVAAFADPATASDKANGARACTALKASMGTSFASTYSNFGKCVSAWTRAAHQNRHEAQVACAAEKADAAAFAASHAGKTFEQYYGVGKQGKNAMQRCIQSKAQKATSADQRSTVKAGKKCKAERAAIGAVDFKAKYGGKANAFAKCVAALVK